MLVHICCSVDSEFFIKSLKELMPNEKFIGYFYDPNIHPYSEFLLRYEDAKRSCKGLGVEILCGEYDLNEWFSYVKGFENEPERGERCQKCFDFRLESSAKIAKELGEKSLTTTLLMSPKKEFLALTQSLEQICAKFDLKPFYPDFRKNSGTQKQFKLAKERNLYHQDYCGCIYGLIRQKQHKEEIIFDLTSPISRQIQPNSIEDKLKFYKKLAKFEEKGIKFETKKEKFLNYRLLNASLAIEGKIVPSYFLFYSHFSREMNKISIKKGEIYHCERDEIIVVSLAKFNQICKFDYKSVNELLTSPPKVKKELKFRKFLTSKKSSLSPVIIIDELQDAKGVVRARDVIFSDSRQRVIFT